ncbi:KTSC domain-containing protein [Bradyrhizobium yuanmingense]|uniref:KTSC domain-containing protein n=1 Tax=Bradyrhizobium yuanmingense TaxID=108015 RepID=UPI001FD97AA1|nr:KTSC domain-containing protein [Bradyrhizobium yuanmingense]
MRTPVRSATLVSVGYDEVKQLLEIEFRKSSVYQYSGVPKSVYRQLMAASSKGRFFDQRIRSQFKTLRLS